MADVTDVLELRYTDGSVVTIGLGEVDGMNGMGHFVWFRGLDTLADHDEFFAPVSVVGNIVAELPADIVMKVFPHFDALGLFETEEAARAVLEKLRTGFGLVLAFKERA
jgi:hypothetical protein